MSNINRSGKIVAGFRKTCRGIFGGFREAAFCLQIISDEIRDNGPILNEEKAFFSKGRIIAGSNDVSRVLTGVARLSPHPSLAW